MIIVPKFHLQANTEKNEYVCFRVAKGTLNL